MTPPHPLTLPVHVPGLATREPDVTGSWQQAGQAALEQLRNAADRRSLPELAATLTEKLRQATTGEISDEDALHAARALTRGEAVLLRLTDENPPPIAPG
jgi:adenosylmethionine-8-amino-7-oxononanoate aminotransferase